MRTALGVGLCVVLNAAAGSIAAQSVTAGNVTLRITGRMQFQFNTTSVADDEITSGAPASLAASSFETRRVRTALQMRIDEWITGLVEPDFALARFQIRQAWMNLAFDPAFELKMGQFKKPFSQIFLTSSTEVSAIERGQRIRGLYEYLALRDEAASGPAVLSVLRGVPLMAEEHDLLDMQGYLGYEMGASVHGVVGAFDYDAGIFNGSGPDRRDENDGKSLAGRLRWRAPTATPLAVSGAASYHEMALTTTSEVEGTAWMLDFEVGAFKRSGVHLIAEATTGENLASGESFRAAHALFSLYRPVTHARVDGLEPVARISWADPDAEVDGDEGVYLTPGFNIYFEGRNRFMVNWDVFAPSGDRFEMKHALRAQAQLTW